MVTFTPVRYDAQQRANGPNEQAFGDVTFRPNRTQTEEGHGVGVSGFTVAYKNAAVTVQLADLPVGMAWLVEANLNGYIEEGCIRPTGTVQVNYHDLPQLDPVTLSPAAVPEAAWTVELNNRVPTAGTTGHVLTKGAGGSNAWSAAGAGSGDVVGPASSVDNRLPRFSGTGGKTIDQSAVTIDDAGAMTGMTTVDGRDVSVDGTKLDGIASGATANASDAQLRDRATHTGTQSADTLTDGTTNNAFLATERTKLAGVATGATANDTDANLKARANHTGTQAASTVTGLASIATSGSASDLTGGTIPTSVLPPLAINDVFTVASQAAMLALTAEKGDVAVRTDVTKTFILSTNSPSTLADWKEIPAVGLVQSVNSQQGAVVLGKSDVGLSNVDNTADTAKPVSTAQQAALDLKAPLASPAFTGTPTGITKTHVGLNNVDNTSDANKPVSTATQTALGLKRDKTYLTGVPFTVYGHSFTDDTLSTITPGTGYYRQAGTELNAGTVTTYGLGGTRIAFTAGSLISSGAMPGLATPVAGSVWPGATSRQGPVIFDTLTNDVGHYVTTANPVAISGAGGDRYLAAMRNQHETVLAVASSEARIENTPSATVVYTGTWPVTNEALAYMSGGAYAYTTTPGAAVTFTLTAAQIPQSGPLAGRVWLKHFQFDPGVLTNADILVKVDGVTSHTWSKTEWEAYGSLTGVHAVTPVTLPVDGAGHTVTFEHAGSAGQFISPDALILASVNPGPILVMAPPLPLVGTTWNATEVATWKANLLKVEPKVKEAVAFFPNAIYVPSTMTAEGIHADGIHPNDRGSTQRRNDVVETLHQRFGAYMRSHQSGDTALPVAAAKSLKIDLGLGNVTDVAQQPLDSDLTAIAALAPSNDDVVQRKSGAWTNRTPAQLKTDLALVKGDVGLGNVDNTSDANKPVSTAQQTALDGKQPLDADLTTIAGLTATSDNVIQSVAGAWASRTMAQLKTALALVKGDVGLGNVDNTSDATKNAATATLTNKRINRRVFSTADTATLTIDSDSYDGAKVTALAQAMTIAEPTGTEQPMQSLIIRIKDNGTARALTWNAAFRAIGVTLPTTTVISKTVYVGCIWNSDDLKWDAIAVAAQV